MNSTTEHERYYRENQDYIVKNQMNLPLSYDFLREFKEILDWNYILSQTRLHVWFLEEMIEYIQWGKLCLDAFQNIPESFMLKHKDLFAKYGIYESLRKGTVIDVITDDIWEFIRQLGRKHD